MDNVETQEDILAVAEELSNDLSSIASDSAEKSEEPKAEEQASDPESPEEEPAAETEEEPAAEEKVSEDNSDKADVQAEEAVDSEKAEKSEEKPEETQVVSEEEKKEDSLNDTKEVTETDEATLSAKIKLLEEENAKLKKALHRTLVERVVDAKIAAGVEDAEAREGLIEDHSNRTASSLADSLRDLAKMPAVKTAKASMPEINSETEAVEGENNVLTLDGQAKEEKETTPTAEQLFVDALMGRRKL